MGAGAGADSSLDSRHVNGQRIVFIGAAGEMCRVAIQRFAEAVEGADWKLELYDIRPEVLDDLVELLPSGSVSVGSFDLFDGVALSSAIEGAALVVLGAGPYIRTAEPVRAACIDNKVAYLDLDDDEASTRAALVLDAAARAAEVPIFVGCGASPGLTNVMAVDAARDMDSVDRIDVCWVTGDEERSRSGVRCSTMPFVGSPASARPGSTAARNPSDLRGNRRVRAGRLVRCRLPAV